VDEHVRPITRITERKHHMPVIEVRDLTRRFDEFTAVDDVSFEVEPGEIFGFLGPNGAGKSTTINMLCTLLKPTEGTALINGFDVSADQDRVRRSIGLIFQEPSLDERLTAWQNLQFHAMLYDVPPNVFDARAKELLEMVGLTDRVRDDVKSFSGGMKRRLEIVLGLLHHPTVLFLDEPTIGLDPQTRRHIWDYLESVRDSEGLTIFLTTHYMEEAEICDRIAVIDHGSVVACDTPDALKTSIGQDVVTLRTTDDEAAAAALEGVGVACRVTDDGLRVEGERGDELVPHVCRAIDGAARSDAVLSVTMERPTLEDVFIQLTGKTIREEEASDHERMRSMRQAHGGGGPR
jgi:ABC-2 type transport system ATP-binding protein